MELQVAALCDAAADYEGKLSMLGAFDGILAQQFPILHPQCSVALRIVFRKEEEGVPKLLVKFGDEDGRPIVQQIDTPFEVRLPKDSFFATHNLVLNLQRLKFDRPGVYSVDLYIDGASVASLPLQVRLLEKPAGLN